jgi:hypothetical protein
MAMSAARAEQLPFTTQALESRTPAVPAESMPVAAETSMKMGMAGAQERTKVQVTAPARAAVEAQPEMWETLVREPSMSSRPWRSLLEMGLPAAYA